ncbi:hypothetical protein LTR93_011549 [Exophiala xenobiotica]|nr:hypothetical protein LTR93_011549 [Exophiala xenobiotica]
MSQFFAPQIHRSFGGREGFTGGERGILAAKGQVVGGHFVVFRSTIHESLHFVLVFFTMRPVRLREVEIQHECIKSVTPKREVCEEFVEHYDLWVKRTAWSGPRPSWFKNGDVNGSLNLFPGSRMMFFDLLWEPRYEDYKIEYWSKNRFNYFGNGFMLDDYVGGSLMVSRHQ